ncbi:hypothetical protein AGMMS50262_07700 [Bacteroidia bacterium]|nr:hypothetical protein AGMMS50262_07700 [Bacteroidia bacterium]
MENPKEAESEEIRIVKVQGSDPLLHRLIGPMVIHPLVISLNGGYPFKNTEEHLWYIAIRGNKETKETAGFLSVLNNTIENDCTLRDQLLLARLVKTALADMPAGTVVRFTAHKDEIPLMKELGFELTNTKRPAVEYFKMFKKI